MSYNLGYQKLHTLPLSRVVKWPGDQDVQTVEIVPRHELHVEFADGVMVHGGWADGLVYRLDESISVDVCAARQHDLCRRVPDFEQRIENIQGAEQVDVIDLPDIAVRHKGYARQMDDIIRPDGTERGHYIFLLCNVADQVAFFIAPGIYQPGYIVPGFCEKTLQMDAG